MDTPVGNEAPPQGRRVVIVDGGFGGLIAAKELRRADADAAGGLSELSARAAEELASLRVTLRLGLRATGVSSDREANR